MTQKKIAMEIGVSPSVLCAVLHGRYKEKNSEKARRVHVWLDKHGYTPEQVIEMTRGNSRMNGKYCRSAFSGGDGVGYGNADWRALGDIVRSGRLERIPGGGKWERRMEAR